MRRLRLAFALVLLAAGCSTPTEPTFVRTETMFVAAVTIDCVGLGPMTCLQVRSHPAAAWSRFHGGIEGFSHVEGVEYELLVAVYRVHNPPADGSSVEYRLIRVVSRVATPPG